MGKKLNERIRSTNLNDIIKDRGPKYGPPLPSMHNIAEAFHSVLCGYYQIKLPPLPPDIASLMIVGMKIVRAARPNVYHQDNYDDATNYLRFAESFHPDNPNFGELVPAEDDWDVDEKGVGRENSSD